MGHYFAATVLQLRLHAHRVRKRRLARDEGPGRAPTGNRLPAHPHATHYGRRHHPVGPGPGARLRHGLVYVVARRAGVRRAAVSGDRPYVQLQARLPRLPGGGRAHRGRGGRPMTTSQPSQAAAPVQYFQVGDEGASHGGGTLLGFWIYLMSDALLFAAVFATFGVMSSSFAGGPTPREL